MTHQVSHRDGLRSIERVRMIAIADAATGMCALVPPCTFQHFNSFESPPSCPRARRLIISRDGEEKMETGKSDGNHFHCEKSNKTPEAYGTGFSSTVINVKLTSVHEHGTPILLELRGVH